MTINIENDIIRIIRVDICGRIPLSMRAKDLEKLLKQLGFVQNRSNGSHRIYKHPNGCMQIVPFHNGDLKTGLEQAILKNLKNAGFDI